MKKVTCLYFIGIFFILSSCSNDESSRIINDDGDDINTIGFIEPAFINYAESFNQEMGDRGRNISLNQIDIVFVNEITAPNSSQFCAYGYPSFQSTGRPRIEVINSFQCWSRWSDIEKENLIYHELGHALLNLPHFNGFLPNGAPENLMCASNTCNNYRIYNKHQQEQRSYYLDRLISGTGIPDWASEKFFSRLIAEDDLEATTLQWNSAIENQSSNDIPYEFSIELNSPFSNSTALRIDATEATESSAIGYWYRDFDLSNFSDCSNLVVTADIQSNNLNSGIVALVIDLMEVNDNGELERFARAATIKSTSGTFSETQVTSICIKEEAVFARVLLYMDAPQNTSARIDNIVLDLFE